MNKLAFFAAALLALLVLASPWIAGSVIEARVRERVEAIDASPSAEAEIASYERGWFRSSVKLAIELAPESTAARANDAGASLGAFGRLPIAVELAHGPIAVLDGVHFGWAKTIARADVGDVNVADLEQTLGVPYLFEFRGRTGYLGNLGFDADAPPFELPIGEALLTFSGAMAEGTFAANRLTGSGDVSDVAIRSPTGTFVLRGMRATVDNELRSRYVLPGEATLSLASVSATGPVQGAAPLLEAQSLRFRGATEIDPAGTLLAMRLNYDLDSLRLQNNEITAGTVEVRVRNLDAAALEAYGSTVSEAAAGADPAAALTSLGPHLERALRAEPSVVADPIRFRYGGEPFDGRVEISTNPARLPAAGTLSLDDPLLMLELFNVSAELRASKALTTTLVTLAARLQLASDFSIAPDELEYMVEAQSGLMLAMLLGQGVLVEDGDNYRSSIDYSDGALTLNGNRMPLGQL